MKRLLLLGMIGLVGCAAGAPQPQPDFPIHARDQIFELDYRIDRHPDRVEAVGLIASRTTTTFGSHAQPLRSGGGRAGREPRLLRHQRDLGRAPVVLGGAHADRKEERYELNVGNYSIGLGM